MHVSKTLVSTYGYFKFKEKKYLHGTIVKFNKQWLVDNGYPLCGEVQNGGNPLDTIPSGECLYGKFQSNNYSKYSFTRCRTSDCKADFYTTLKNIMITPEKFNDAIEEVVSPIELVKNPEKKWNEVPEVKMLLMFYILLMLVSFIFTEPWGPWIVWTILFIVFKQKAIDHASDNDGPWWND